MTNKSVPLTSSRIGSLQLSSPFLYPLPLNPSYKRAWLVCEDVRSDIELPPSITPQWIFYSFAQRLLTQATIPPPFEVLLSTSCAAQVLSCRRNRVGRIMTGLPYRLEPARCTLR